MIFLNQNFPFAFMLKNFYCNYFASLDIAFRARHHDFPAPASSSHGVGVSLAKMVMMSPSER